MFIQKIVLTNFRSYSDSTIIQFDSNMMVIQDNASYDCYNAISWSLLNRGGRYKAVQDQLLFAGDSIRSPATYTEVAISIDNNRAYLPIPNSNLSIQRRYYRVGRSEFFMDGLGCRLKDITNLLQEHLHPQSMATWGIEQRESLIKYSPKTLRFIWDASAGALPNRKRIQTLEKHLERIQIDITRIQQSIDILIGSMDITTNFSPKDSNNSRERTDYLRHVLMSLNEDFHSTEETIAMYKKSICESFDMMFSLFQTTFTKELRRWGAPRVQLELTDSKNMYSTGIKLAFTSSISLENQNRISWAFWSASMHILPLPICLVQVELSKEVEPSMVIETLNMLSSTKQIIIFDAGSISNKRGDYYQSSKRGIRASFNNATSVFSTSYE